MAWCPIRHRSAVRLPAGRRASSPTHCGSASTRSPRSGRLDREIEFVEDHARGLPSGSEHDIKRAFAELDDEGAIAIVGPSISDNALIAAPLCDAARLPAINYSGGERTRSQWMFHYQVGSLEEEPPLLAARMVERGLRQRGRRVRPVARRPPLRRVLRSGARPARARGHRHREHLVAGRVRRRPAERASGDGNPDVLVYLGLGVSSRAVAVARLELGWDVPVLANSALMFGYARPDWRDGYAGWEYIDTVADDNRQRARAEGALAARRRAARSAAPPTTSAACSARRSRRRTTSPGPASPTGSGARSSSPRRSGYDGTLMGFGTWSTPRSKATTSCCANGATAAACRSTALATGERS